MSNELFKAIRNKASIEEVKEILQKCPEAIKAKDKDGYLPLHYALWENNSDNVIYLLFEKYPQAAKVKKNDGWLPLHCALRWKASDKIIKMLVNANPEATKD